MNKKQEAGWRRVRRLNVKGDKLVKAFDAAVGPWYWEQDQGTNADDIRDARLKYEAADAGLRAYIADLEAVARNVRRAQRTMKTITGEKE